MKVSVIIPIYNAEHYLESCIESLFKQTLQDIEFVFVDDCSSDNSYRKLQKLVNDYSGDNKKVIIHQHAKNSGVASIRNTGLSLASGEYIGWLDADDWIEPDMFEKLYQKAIQDNSDIVWCDFINVFNDGQQYVSQNYTENLGEHVIGFLRGQLFGGMWNKIAKKSLYERYNIKFPDGLNMCEDMRVNIQLFHYAVKVSYLNASFYFYNKININSISAKSVKNSQVNYQWIENVKGIVEFVERTGIQLPPHLLSIFKLSPKKNLLIHGLTINAYKEWKSIFPESNYAVKYTNYPLPYKLLAKAADKDNWWFIKIWILVKYKLFGK